MNHRMYLSLAIPLTISTMSTPLLGAVDTAVVGKLSDPAYIGGVAVGTIIFNTMYWLFGFLRVSTSAFAAQAEGARDEHKACMALIRPFMIAAIIGLLFIVIQKPILNVSLGAIASGIGCCRLCIRLFRYSDMGRAICSIELCHL